MTAEIKKNKPLSNATYKKMDGNRLIMLFTPMISNLINRFAEDRYEKDMRQDLILELLNLQKKYKAKKGGAYFPAYIKMHMLNAAGMSRAKNSHAIYTCPSQIRKMIRENREVPSVQTIPDEDYHIHYEALHTVPKDSKESNLFSVLKIILEKIRDSDYDETTKQNIKDYIRNFLDNDINKKLQNKKIKKLLNGTILSKLFNK